MFHLPASSDTEFGRSFLLGVSDDEIDEDDVTEIGEADALPVIVLK